VAARIEGALLCPVLGGVVALGAAAPLGAVRRSATTVVWGRHPTMYRRPVAARPATTVQTIRNALNIAMPPPDAVGDPKPVSVSECGAGKLRRVNAKLCAGVPAAKGLDQGDPAWA
jgi:hypothetical protein